MQIRRHSIDRTWLLLHANPIYFVDNMPFAMRNPHRKVVAADIAQSGLVVDHRQRQRVAFGKLILCGGFKDEVRLANDTKGLSLARKTQ
ncbi:hypothetical protein CCGE525_37035 (plasmid) [Rhizobium jaguaris]|uniref:Uncharacterized protein n=1 Tax=Rhizobium jaguaris TaxID=1312183 RepID=A0A387G0C4_9HYPH|nr:hypothetical protein CCGE525_37035 [Rhizobium jaguaris]